MNSTAGICPNDSPLRLNVDLAGESAMYVAAAILSSSSLVRGERSTGVEGSCEDT